ncbi:uncharacterized protein [Leptinotarsa decemlineata]|uniref:uncharacterized protein n=1 Tax=Leptinotarsa decemlineata TaxID=7539 RepID=UPI000C254203|nr:alpha-1D adrenergic receptor [Leptinotarsa decemlineata]XP_023024097.1 alpha-1D adrenergic receptor [Leptinotarsa decemlineata]
MDSNYHWLITIGLVTSSVIAVTANFLLLVIFCRKRSLRTVPNRFVINLLITNLLSSILLIPLLLVDQETHSYQELSTRINTSSITQFDNVIIQEEIHGDPTTNTVEIIETTNVISGLVPPSTSHNTTNLLCYFAQSTTSFVCTASIFSILLIGINQYFGVIHSLRYHFYINRCKSSILIGISWFVALFCAILSSVTYSDSSVWHFCRNRPPVSETVKVLNTVYAFGYFFLVILAPFVAICIIYVCIYTAAHQNSERMRRSASAPLNPNIDTIQVSIPISSSPDKGRDALPKVHSAPNLSTLEKEFKVDDRNRSKVNRTSSDRSSSSFISTLKHKISNASVFRYREETRAAKISVLVIFLVLVCYVPYGITLILCSKCIRVETSQIFNYLSLVLLVFSNIISPFLFGYRNKRVKMEICKLFSFTKPNLDIISRPRKPSVMKQVNIEDINEDLEDQHSNDPFIDHRVVPEVVVTCKQETERKSILKRVCNTNWTSYKKCNFITVPDSCISGEARGSFSSASTQISTED